MMNLQIKNTVVVTPAAFRNIIMSIMTAALSCSIRSVYKPAQSFFGDIVHAEYRAATDVYAFMFLTDVIDFIIIVFGFWAFGVRVARKEVVVLSSFVTHPTTDWTVTNQNHMFLLLCLLSFRNIVQQLTSPLVCQRTRYLRPSW